MRGSTGGSATSRVPGRAGFPSTIGLRTSCDRLAPRLCCVGALRFLIDGGLYFDAALRIASKNGEEGRGNSTLSRKKLEKRFVCLEHLRFRIRGLLERSVSYPKRLKKLFKEKTLWLPSKMEPTKTRSQLRGWGMQSPFGPKVYPMRVGGAAQRCLNGASHEPYHGLI